MARTIIFLAEPTGPWTIKPSISTLSSAPTGSRVETFSTNPGAEVVVGVAVGAGGGGGGGGAGGGGVGGGCGDGGGRAGGGWRLRAGGLRCPRQARLVRE